MFVAACGLQQVRNRIANLREAGTDPMEVILSPETWIQLKREYLSLTPRLQPLKLSVRDVLSVRGRLVAGTYGCVIRYFGGVEFPPDPAITDGFVDGTRFS